MDKIDYTSRAALMSAVVDFRKRGILAEVVGNGKTLQFPNGVDSTPEDEEPEQEPVVPPNQEEEESLLGVVQPPLPEQPATGQATPEPVAGEAAGEQSVVEDEHTGDGVSQTESATAQPAGDPQEKTADEDDVEDLIGAPAAKPAQPQPTKSQKRNRNRNS